MNTTTLRELEQALHGIGDSFPNEPWKGEHDAAMRCRDLEERFATGLAALDELAGSLRGPIESIVAGEPLSVSGLSALTSLCERFSDLYRQVETRVLEVEDQGFVVEGWGEYRERLDAIAEFLNPVSQRLESAWFRLPAEPSGSSRTGEATTDAPLGSTDDAPRRVKVRTVTERLPDPFFLTDEISAPFDFPRFGVWERVKARPGLTRLPDPLD